MRISAGKIKSLCREKGLNLGGLLGRACVSRTAYYALVRKDEILPRSLRTIASTLGVKPTAFLEEEGEEAAAMREIIERADVIVKERPGLDRENVRHTLIMLGMKPVDRLRKALTRGRLAVPVLKDALAAIKAQAPSRRRRGAKTSRRS